MLDIATTEEEDLKFSNTFCFSRKFCNLWFIASNFYMTGKQKEINQIFIDAPGYYKLRNKRNQSS